MTERVSTWISSVAPEKWLSVLLNHFCRLAELDFYLHAELIARAARI